MMPPKKPSAFPQLPMGEANIQCRPFNPHRSVTQSCPVCTMRVILHCDECRIQVSGCLCVWETLYGAEIARQRLIDKGIWLPQFEKEGLIRPPGMHDGDREIDPDILHGG